MNEAHKRKCWNCGNVAIHMKSIVPEVLCTKCGSQDTRRIQGSEREAAAERLRQSLVLGSGFSEQVINGVRDAYLAEHPDIKRCYAFLDSNGTIDLDSLGETHDDVRLKVLASSMGWRFEHPGRYSHDEEWQRLQQLGSVVPVSVTVEHNRITR